MAVDCGEDRGQESERTGRKIRLIRDTKIHRLFPSEMWATTPIRWCDKRHAKYINELISGRYNIQTHDLGSQHARIGRYGRERTLSACVTKIRRKKKKTLWIHFIRTSENSRVCRRMSGFFFISHRRRRCRALIFCRVFWEYTHLFITHRTQNATECESMSGA